MVAVNDNLIIEALRLCEPKAHFYCRNAAVEPEDLLQDFAVKLPAVLERVQPGLPWQPFVMTSFRNFFFRIARRRSGKQAATLAGVDVAVDQYLRDDSAAELIGLVDDADTRQALTMMFMDGQSTNAIAIAMGCTVRTVQRKINSGLTDLRGRLGEP